MIQQDFSFLNIWSYVHALSKRLIDLFQLYISHQAWLKYFLFVLNLHISNLTHTASSIKESCLKLLLTLSWIHHLKSPSNNDPCLKPMHHVMCISTLLPRNALWQPPWSHINSCFSLQFHKAHPFWCCNARKHCLHAY